MAKVAFLSTPVCLTGAIQPMDRLAHSFKADQSCFFFKVLQSLIPKSATSFLHMSSENWSVDFHMLDLKTVSKTLPSYAPYAHWWVSRSSLYIFSGQPSQQEVSK